MEQLTSYLNKIIALIGIRNLIIIGVILLLLIIALLIYRSLKLKVYRQEIVEIENQMNGIKTLPIQYRLGRVQSIAKNMKEVAEQYEEFAKEHNRIVDFQQNELGVLVNEVDEQLFYGKLRGAKKKLAKLRQMNATYEKDSKELLKKIEKVTEIENIQRIEIIRVKEKYREVTNQYDESRSKIESFVPKVNVIFNSIDEDFVKLEGMMNNQLFEDAKAFTKQIEGRIEALSADLKDLPSYVSVVSKLLPGKVEKVAHLIEDLQEDVFALEQLNAEDRYDEIEEELEESVDLVKAVEIKEAGEKLEVLTDHIESLVIDLSKEKTSYKTFKERWSILSKEIERIDQDYETSMRAYHEMEKKYVIDLEAMPIASTYEEFTGMLKEYKQLNDKLGSGDFAYSDTLETVENMIASMAAHDAQIKSFNSQKEKLEIVEKKAEDELENINIVLLEIKSEIKNNHLPMINDSYKDYIQDSYRKAEEIKEFKENKPVKLEELSKKVDGARDVIYKLYDNVHNLIITAEMVEEAIVFGNRFRSTYMEVNTELTKAEVLFRNGEYTKALATAVDIIEKIEPGSYEKMIKKQEEVAAN
ncbi:septation ring formation regulator EzrA [Kandleria vitulina]|jgi:septation ring formation regulator EzrA|uniref:septation ring formation regulator EzrA n=1 Tax=Kandleria vitulina TaxID=1630 RepID=UPI00048AD190|nr:septation ring formation regulator EzrA [Kandleria vitulina]